MATDRRPGTLFARTLAAAILLWRWPKLRTRKHELAFFAIAIVGTAINNIVPAMLSS